RVLSAGYGTTAVGPVTMTAVRVPKNPPITATTLPARPTQAPGLRSVTVRFPGVRYIWTSSRAQTTMQRATARLVRTPILAASPPQSHVRRTGVATEARAGTGSTGSYAG